MKSDDINILALDSATEACSVALLTGQGVTQQFEVIGRGHAEHLLPMIEAVLSQSEMAIEQVDLFAYGAGPGSFTGIRIGAAMMQGLALARGKKLVAVSSLAALAAQYSGKVLAVIDARMDEVYHALFDIDEDGYPAQCSVAGVASPSDIQLPHAGEIIAVGSGWDRYSEVFKSICPEKLTIRGIDSGFPHAQAIARLALHEYRKGNAVDPADALPEYVRDNVAKKMGER
jgi:tRNA threonylcarbamoyladenosine biosynthesis protein TsaB